MLFVPPLQAARMSVPLSASTVTYFMGKPIPTIVRYAKRRCPLGAALSCVSYFSLRSEARRTLVRSGPAV